MNMPKERECLCPRILMTITRVEDEEKLEKLLKEVHLPIVHQCFGKGTAPTEKLDIFGLSGSCRLITMIFLSRQKGRNLFHIMEQRLDFRKRGGGIALTIPVTGLQNHTLNLLKNEEHSEVENYMEEKINEELSQTESNMEYVIICVSISAGYSDDVIDAARSAGAKGGTVLKGRRRDALQVSPYLGLPNQEGQEFVIIVAPKTKKREIMLSINHSCGLGTDAHGVIVSLPVEDVLGLEL